MRVLHADAAVPFQNILASRLFRKESLFSLLAICSPALALHADSKALLQANLDSQRAYPRAQRLPSPKHAHERERSSSPTRVATIPASWDKSPGPSERRTSPSPQQPQTPDIQRPKSVREASNDFFEAALNRPKPSAASRAVVPTRKGTSHRWDDSFLDGMRDLTATHGRDGLPPCMQGALDCMHQRSCSPTR